MREREHDKYMRGRARLDQEIQERERTLQRDAREGFAGSRMIHERFIRMGRGREQERGANKKIVKRG
jgi:hypothetical protein